MKNLTNQSVIKAEGLKTKRIDTQNYKGVFGGTCNHVVGLLNSKEEVLHLDGKPYFPCGRAQAFAALIKSGDVYSKFFSFQKISK
jgi:hypothetical protein